MRNLLGCTRGEEELYLTPTLALVSSVFVCLVDGESDDKTFSKMI